MSGFTDLRLNRAGSHQDESFWPSFTDIMMVVVMIFLITSATLILRNTELMTQLLASEEAEKAASAIIENSEAENTTLEQQLEVAKRQLAALRLQQLRIMEEKFITNGRLEDALQKLELMAEKLNAEQSQSGELKNQLGGLRSQLNQVQHRYNSSLVELDNTTQLLRQLQAEHDLSRSQLQELISKLAASEQLVTEFTELLAESEDRSAETAEALEAAQAQQESSQEEIEITDEKLAALKAEYNELKTKYDKLVRPARSDKGKYAVSVRYVRSGGQSNILVKTPESGRYAAVSEQRLHSQLAALKESKGDQLYIRIIIPDDSNLSYNEAWSFTNDLLTKYDYYYQEKPASNTQ